jgi:hypothetical protein
MRLILIANKRKTKTVGILFINNIFVYNAILKLIWAHGIYLWGTAYASNIDNLERFQSKILRVIVDTPWYMPNMFIQTDLKIPTVKGEIRHYSSQYSAHLSEHPNDLVVHLMAQTNRRLRRHSPKVLPTRF